MSYHPSGSPSNGLDRFTHDQWEPIVDVSNFSVQGGFWPGAEAMQTPGAPFLSVTRLGANIVISWNPAMPGFVLQQTTALSPANWQNAPSGITNNIMLLASGASRFYRLLKP